MCLGYRQFDRKTRRQVAFGNLCLAIGLLLWNFAHPAGALGLWVHFLSGMLLGISIAVNLCAVRAARRCREKEI